MAEGNNSNKISPVNSASGNIPGNLINQLPKLNDSLRKSLHFDSDASGIQDKELTSKIRSSVQQYINVENRRSESLLGQHLPRGQSASSIRRQRLTDNENDDWLKFLENEICVCMKKLELLCKNDQNRATFFTELESEILKYLRLPVKSVDDYIQFALRGAKVMIVLNSLQLRTSAHFTEINNHDNDMFLFIVFDLSYYLVTLVCQYERGFLQSILSAESNFHSILFASVPETPDQIRSHANILSVVFHLDRSEEEQSVSLSRFFLLLSEDLKKQSIELTENCISQMDTVESHTKNGKKHFDYAFDYKCARKHVWSNLTQLSEDDLKKLNDVELATKQRFYAIAAYEHYRAAMQELEVIRNERHEKEQVELSSHMAFSLGYVDNNFALEIQIYEVIAVYLFAKSNTGVLNDFFKNETKRSMFAEVIAAFRNDSINVELLQSKLLSKIRFDPKNTDLSSDTNTVKSNSGLIYDSTQAGIGASYMIGDLLLSGFSEVNTIIIDALHHYHMGRYSKFVFCLTKRYADGRMLVGIREIEENNTCKITLDIRPNIIVNQFLYYKYSPESIANFLLLLGEVFLSAPELKPRKTLSPNMSLQLPSYSEFIQIAMSIFDEVISNIQLSEYAQRFKHQVKPQIILDIDRRIDDLKAKLPSGIQSVSSDYFKKQALAPSMDRFENVRSIAKVNYATALLLTGTQENFQKSFSLIRNVEKETGKELREEKLFIETKVRLQALIDILTVFGFNQSSQSDDNVLVSLGQKFSRMSMNISIKPVNKILNEDESVSRCETVILFDDDEIDDFMLLDKLLDDILRLDKNKFADKVCENYKDNIKPYTPLINDIIRKNNFNSILSWKTSFLKQDHPLTFEHLPLLSVMYKIIFVPCTIQIHPNHSRIFVPTKEKIKVFSEDSTIATIYVITEVQNTFTITRPIGGICKICDVSLNFLHDQLELCKTPDTEADVKTRIAFFHQQQAEKSGNTQCLIALQRWAKAKDLYKESLNLKANHMPAILGYIRCLIMLSKYSVAEKFIQTNAEEHPTFNCSAERWLLLGIIKRKLQNYSEAKSAIEKALSLNANYAEAKIEFELVSKLLRETVSKRIEEYKKMSLIHSEPNSQQYNILSIDGGGIRGLIPAIWMSELERQTKLRSSSMFHMMAGTSTGAIVAAGLSIPKMPDIREPRFKAMDIVSLYQEKANNVFLPESMSQHLFGYRHKYSDKGRQRLFHEYFGDTRLSQTLTDLIVTTVNSSSNATELFQRSDALRDRSKDYKIVDVLMCTSAAPTYFPPYKLNGSVFIDGGVQANNPAMIAYADACKKCSDRDKILLLSLGTGDYVPDPLKPEAERNILFWFSNFSSVLKTVFDGPQHNIDRELSNMLANDMYHRWQIWLENPIVLDDIRKETLDNLAELAHAYFEEIDALDNEKRLGKLIERLKGQ